MGSARRTFRGLRMGKDESKLLAQLARRLGEGAPRGAVLAREVAVVFAAHVLGVPWPRVRFLRERRWRRALQALLLASSRPGEAA